MSDPATFQEIADEIGITRQSVHVIYQKALKKLATNPRCRELLEDFEALQTPKHGCEVLDWVHRQRGTMR